MTHGYDEPLWLKMQREADERERAALHASRVWTPGPATGYSPEGVPLYGDARDALSLYREVEAGAARGDRLAPWLQHTDEVPSAIERAFRDGYEDSARFDLGPALPWINAALVGAPSRRLCVAPAWPAFRAWRDRVIEAAQRRQEARAQADQGQELLRELLARVVALEAQVRLQGRRTRRTVRRVAPPRWSWAPELRGPSGRSRRWRRRALAGLRARWAADGVEAKRRQAAHSRGE
jgi:hypothetical protein